MQSLIKMSEMVASTHWKPNDSENRLDRLYKDPEDRITYAYLHLLFNLAVMLEVMFMRLCLILIIARLKLQLLLLQPVGCSEVLETGLKTLERPLVNQVSYLSDLILV